MNVTWTAIDVQVNRIDSGYIATILLEYYVVYGMHIIMHECINRYDIHIEYTLT